MKKSTQIQKKTYSRLVGVLLVFSVFSVFSHNNNNNNNASLFIQAGTKAIGIEQIYVTPTPITQITGFIYVKEKTIFYAGKNKVLKIVYISNTKKVEKNEKLITFYHKEKLQPQKKNQLQLQFKPISKHSFKFSYLSYYGTNYLAIAFPNTLQSATTNTLFKNKISTIVSSVVSILYNTSSATTNNNFTYKTSKYNLRILETNFGRPPPFV